MLFNCISNVIMKKFILIVLILLNFCYAFSQESNFAPERLSGAINTEYEERNPVISPDGKTLYFIRQGDPRNVGYQVLDENQNIWFSTKGEDGKWQEAQNIGEPLNNAQSNGVMGVSPDGNTLLLFGSYRANSPGGGASMSRRTKDGWSYPMPLIIKNFINKSRWYQFSLGSDGKTLLMAIESDKGYGENDLFVSFLQRDDTWSEPLNLGKQVNTILNEISPFLAADGVTLYFSTNGRGGYGDYDVYVTRRLDGTWKNWSEPENLGDKINTAGFDAYYKISAEGDYAYYTSTINSIGRGDIFRVKLPERVKPKPVVLIYGKVINSSTREPLEARVLYEILPGGSDAGRANSTPNTGEYKMILPAGYNYGFRGEAQGFISVNDNIDLTNLEEYKEIKRDIEMMPIRRGESVRLNNIFFDYDKSELREESFPELDRVVVFLNQNPLVEIKIAGHTDSIGTDIYNKNLSHSRAKSVADYIISKGIEKKRVDFEGFGKSKPIADNETEEGRQKNRRVEFMIIKD